MRSVVVVGAGGREHALVHALQRDASVVITPGNPAIPGSVDTAPEDLEADLFVIGPEAPLVDGLADRLRAQGKAVFGPGADGAMLEGSKAWMKEALVAAGVPTAAHGTFTAAEPALQYLATMSPPYVVKTDGLAAGKGVVVTHSLKDAQDAVRSYVSGEAFGGAGRTVVIEEGLTGPEVSVLAICNGLTAVALAPAQDFKRIGDGDTGPNTGGMGAYSPVPIASAGLVDDIMSTCVQPTLDYLSQLGIDFRGVLYAGLMLTPHGPKMLEYNVRFGDPETQVVLPRLTSSLTELLLQAANGQPLAEPQFSTDAAVTVVCASEGYPTAPRTGDEIHGVEQAQALDDVTVYAAGVAKGDSGQLVTGGGRVLNITATGPTLDAARQRAYQAAELITWPGKQVRSDIAEQAAKQQEMSS